MGPQHGERWPTEILAPVRALDVPDADRELMLHGNISRILRGV